MCAGNATLVFPGSHVFKEQFVTAAPFERHASGFLSALLQAMNAAFCSAQRVPRYLCAAMSTAPVGGTASAMARPQRSFPGGHSRALWPPPRGSGGGGAVAVSGSFLSSPGVLGSWPRSAPRRRAGARAALPATRSTMASMGADSKSLGGNQASKWECRSGTSLLAEHLTLRPLSSHTQIFATVVKGNIPSTVDVRHGRKITSEEFSPPADLSASYSMQGAVRGDRRRSEGKGGPNTFSPCLAAPGASSQAVPEARGHDKTREAEHPALFAPGLPAPPARSLQSGRRVILCVRTARDARSSSISGRRCEETCTTPRLCLR